MFPTGPTYSVDNVSKSTIAGRVIVDVGRAHILTVGDAAESPWRVCLGCERIDAHSLVRLDRFDGAYGCQQAQGIGNTVNGESLEASEVVGVGGLDPKCLCGLTEDIC